MAADQVSCGRRDVENHTAATEVKSSGHSPVTEPLVCVLRGEFFMPSSTTFRTFVYLSALALPAAYAQQVAGPGGVSHVLLISVDGMHSLDFVNCANGVGGVNNGQPYCPNMAALAKTGSNYLNATTSKPSDSFPGLMAIVSGGSPRTV